MNIALVLSILGKAVYIDEKLWDYQASDFAAVVPNSPGVAFLRLAKKRFLPRYLFPRMVHKMLRYRVLHRYSDFVEDNRVRPDHGNFYPSVVPNWDSTPRVGRNGVVLTDPGSGLFKSQLQWAIEQVENRPPDRRIVFLKSWNERAEGNYLESDEELGDAYLTVCRELLLS